MNRLQLFEAPDTENWYGLYGQKWGDLLPRPALSHPAKFYPHVITRIYRALSQEFDLPPGSLIVDPFAGVGLGALAVQFGYNWFGVELEEKFYNIAAGGIDCSPAIGIAKGLRNLLDKMAGIVEPSPPLGLDSHGFDNPIYKGVLDQTFRPLARDGVTARIVNGDSRNLIDLLGEANAGGLLCSPPFAVNSGGRGEASRRGIKPGLFDRHQGAMTGGIGSRANGNLASLTVSRDGFEALVSSPPFLGQTASAPAAKRGGILASDSKRKGDMSLQAEYGESPGQLASEKPESFWQAAEAILGQAHACLPIGGPAVFICKDAVKNGERFPFSQMWADLCQRQGFRLVKYVRAWQVEKYGQQSFMFGDSVDLGKQHKSFFRLNAEAKGAPRIDHEDILFFVKAAR